MKNRIIAIAILIIVASVAIFLNAKYRPGFLQHAENSQPQDRPLPELTSPEKRVASYTPARGDLKYRLILKPTTTEDPGTGWNLYTSREYGFSFTFPKESQLTTTEALGYQLPPDQAFKGSRDNFEIKIVFKKSAYFLLFLDYPNFHIDNTTTTAATIENINGISTKKIILQSTDPKFASSEGIAYSFEKFGKSYIWYGVFDSADVEAINDFESVVKSTTFTTQPR